MRKSRENMGWGDRKCVGKQREDEKKRKQEGTKGVKREREKYKWTIFVSAEDNAPIYIPGKCNQVCFSNNKDFFRYKTYLC